MISICPYIFIGGYTGSIGRPPTVRLEAPSLSYVAEIREQVGPSAEIFVRWPEVENWEEKLRDPEGSAERWFQQHSPFIQAHPNCIYNSFNEVCGIDDLYARHLLRLLQLMHGINARTGVGDWAVGWPEVSAMSKYDRAIQEMGPGDVLTGHIYWNSVKTLRENIANVKTNPWHMRLFWPGWLNGMVKAVTETGYDYLPDLDCGGPWKTLGILPDQYLNSLQTWDGFLSEQDDCIGAHVFGIGTPWDRKWTPFRADSIWPKVVGQQGLWTPTWTKYWRTNVNEIRVKVPNGRIQVMDIEEYLQGVVPAEMYSSWEMSALEAQAIAARTYALSMRNRHEGYDVCSSQHCQVYAPTRINMRTNQAVTATKGMVMTYKGQMRPTFYSAFCGGITRMDWGEHLKVVSCLCNPRGDTEEKAAQANAHWVERNGQWIKGGHRQGLCQYGAQAMAKQGGSTLEILHHYYNMEVRHDYGQGSIIGPIQEPDDHEKLRILWADYKARVR